MKQRRFLTRVEATYELGLIDAATMSRRGKPHALCDFWREQDVRVAIRFPNGWVEEARDGEKLHAQIYMRVVQQADKFAPNAVNASEGNIELGFTIAQ